MTTRKQTPHLKKSKAGTKEAAILASAITTKKNLNIEKNYRMSGVSVRKKPASKAIHVVSNFTSYLRTAPLIERVRLEREGVSYRIVKGLIGETGLTTSQFQLIVGIPNSTFTKKVRYRSNFSGTPGQSVLGLLELINKVEDMVSVEQDNPDALQFDAKKWVGEWIQRAQPALGGLTPAELMDTPSGRESVMRLLGAIQSGAYQ